jgi:hypothetical protein
MMFLDDEAAASLLLELNNLEQASSNNQNVPLENVANKKNGSESVVLLQLVEENIDGSFEIESTYYSWEIILIS